MQIQTDEKNGRFDIVDDAGGVMLEDCFASVQLSGGTRFSLTAMETAATTEKSATIITAGGDTILPRLQLKIETLDARTLRIRFSVTNTTELNLPIKRISSLLCPGGYNQIPFNDLRLRRTGWQSFSPASPDISAGDFDPWLQPPVQMPMISGRVSERQDLPWMTVLKNTATTPLLVGFESAFDYLGVVHVGASDAGHFLKATNYLEGIDLAPGETFTTEPLLIMTATSENELLDRYGERVGRAMNARVGQAPTGWCSWYYYFDTVTADDVRDNLSTIVEKNLPLEYVQIDDGYQTYFGDWRTINDKFPNGMKPPADQIKQAGKKPGIWLAPFMADARSDLYTQHPDWFIQDMKRRPINVNRYGDPYWPAPNYGLDVTHPEAAAWLRDTITTIVRDWGYEYLKIDFLYAATINGQRYDPNVTGVQAYRRGLEIIREAAGEAYILACGAPLLCSVGLVDGMRISSDIAAAVMTNAITDVTRPWSRDPVSSFISHAWMNQKLWVNDPDCVRLRQHNIASSWPEIESLASLAMFGGGALFSGDDLTRLEQPGFDFLARLSPSVSNVAEVVSVEPSGRPAKLRALVTRGDQSWWLLAEYNWSDEPKSSSFAPTDWELEDGEYHVVDLLSQNFDGSESTPAAPIAPHGVKLLLVSRHQNKPQLIGTTRHLFGPSGDIETVVHSDGVMEVTLTTQGLRDAELLMHVPQGAAVRSVHHADVIHKNDSLLRVKPTARTCRIEY